SSRRRHTRFSRDWSSDVCSSDLEAHDKDALSIGRRPAGLSADPWTAIVLLFHDHEWEQAILEWALDTPAFFIGAQGGFEARRAQIGRASCRERGEMSEAAGTIKT